MKKILVIQTAFIGDVILATGVLEKLHLVYPNAEIDFLVRKGNETLVENHPFIHQLLVWNKKNNKYKNLFSLLNQVRNNKYNAVVNLHRFAASGLITCFSGVKTKLGFDKNPFSFCYTNSTKHEIGNGKHEIERNQMLIQSICKNSISVEQPKLYPTKLDYEITKKYKKKEYVVLAPASVWFTKQLPANKWAELINEIDSNKKVYLVGAPGDISYCIEILKLTSQKNIEILAGKLSFLESAALMKDASMNFTNDSAPLHIASAMNANVTAIFCSTVPEFGFGPTQKNGKVAQVDEKLDCRPCGLHGLKACPKQHFNCAQKIDLNKIAV